MDYIIYFAITIGILVFVHEFGHFAAAKLTGMRADIFAIGFGKRLFGWNKKSRFTFGELPKDFDGQGNTDYRLCLLPLGGYVKIAGMVDESFDTDFADKEPQPYEFRAKSTWKKLIVITAGVIMNLLLALIIFWGVNYFQGKQVITTTKIGYIQPGSTLDSLGFKTDDKILAINGKSVKTWDEVRTDIFVNTLGQDVDVKLQRGNTTEDIIIPRKIIPDNETGERFILPAGFQPAIGEVTKNSPAEKAGIKKGDILLQINKEKIYGVQQTIQIISGHKNIALPVVVERGKDSVTLSVTPDEKGLIGVGLITNPKAPIEFQTYGFFESFYYGWQDIVNMTELTFSMVGKVIGGQVAFGKAFGGPVKIAQLAAKSADTGFLNFLFFLALLSLSLAIINIMPFPVLDGGHLVIILVEGLIKKEIPVKVKIAIQNTGLVILLLLMAFIIYNDIMNL
jgi:regulator of sigma E protease